MQCKVSPGLSTSSSVRGRGNGLLSRELVYLSGESQNGWGGKWILKVIRSTSPVQSWATQSLLPRLVPKQLSNTSKDGDFHHLSGQPVTMCFIFHNHMKSNTCTLWREEV